MNTPYRSFAKCCIVIAVLLAAANFSARAELSLGSVSFGYSDAKPLKAIVPLQANLGPPPSIKFAGKVGGVAFDSTARQAEGAAKPKEILLAYDPNKADGERLQVTVDGVKLTAAIYDWELLPIVRYGNSDSTGCFTPFGELVDDSDSEILLKAGARVFNYDQAFSDTLLGMRLAHLDVLLLDAEFALDLPNDNGEYALGNGEDPPADDRFQRLLTFQQKREQIETDNLAGAKPFATDYQSYVICDYGVPVEFSSDDGKLTLSGEPFYYFWKTDSETKSRLDYILEQGRDAGLIGATETLEEFIDRRKSEIQGSADEATRLAAFQQEMELLGNAATSAYDVDLEAGMIKGVYLKEYSERHAALAEGIAKVNPAVWNAGRKTMRFSAFFRYCQQEFPQAWKVFFDDINKRGIGLQPQVRTPTILFPPSAVN